MKLFEIALFERGDRNKVKTKHGYVSFNWKTDLEDEEEEGYIPDGYSKKVLELSLIEADRGHGDELMKLFLDTPQRENPSSSAMTSFWMSAA